MQLFNSESIICLFAAGLAWLIAQLSKYIISGRSNKTSKDEVSKIFASGGMPSAHSSLVVSTAIIIGLRSGVDSSVFALSVVLAIIVMYDALMVRRAVGEYGEILKKITKRVSPESKYYIRDAAGHTPVEVAVGAVIGAVVAGAVDLVLRFLTFY
jgi:acid phosphatase family membrane protein YuiD